MKESIYIIYGVSGCGKTTVGKQLATQLQLPFFDADDYHPKPNIEKMSGGIPLTDADRLPWLKTLNKLLSEQTNGAVLACSALTENYRQILTENHDSVHWVLLDGSFELIEQRLRERNDHFMGADLLKSQFETLEKADYGLTVNCNDEPITMVTKILNASHSQLSDIGVIGLGVMGKNLALNFLDQEWRVSVYNRHTPKEASVVVDFLREASTDSAVGFTEYQPFVNSLKSPKTILLMIPAGAVTDHVIKEISPLLSDGDVIIDGGNAHFTDSERRSSELKKTNIDFLAMGVSGGEKGARFGPALMPSGDLKTFEKTRPLLQSIAAVSSSGQSCCNYVGKSGSGHFVKMIHNGIEYAEMALIAELYGCLRTSLSNQEIALYFSELNQGESRSYLLEISIDILQKKENNSSVLDTILDKAGNKGTGGWSTKAAVDYGQPATMMTAALFARYTSNLKNERMHTAQRIAVQPSSPIVWNLEEFAKAYQSARIINHHQGFEVIRAASNENDWQVDLSRVADIWTNGCIIRSGLMNECVTLLNRHNSLLENEDLLKTITTAIPSWKAVLNNAMQMNESIPVFSAGLQYWFAMTSQLSNANMIQAQRDYFGAHTYERKDRPGEAVHTDW